MIAAASSQAPHFHEGDHWSLDRTVRFVSVADDIDIQNDDRFEFRVDRLDGKLSMKVSRIVTGTHLPGGVFVPSPPNGQPEEWKIPIANDGQLTLGPQPKDPFERMLARILLAAWNGQPGAEDSKLITVKSLKPDRERLTYDGEAVQSPAKLEGEAAFDPVSQAPVLITLRGENVPIPGGDLRASVKVEYKRPTHAS